MYFYTARLFTPVEYSYILSYVRYYYYYYYTTTTTTTTTTAAAAAAAAAAAIKMSEI